jgi:hypothetical protein
VGDLAVNNVWSDVEGNEAPYGSFPFFPFFCYEWRFKRNL